MDLKFVLDRLREEREQLDLAISNLEGLAEERRPSRRRPLNLANNAATNGTKPQWQISSQGTGEG